MCKRSSQLISPLPDENQVILEGTASCLRINTDEIQLANPTLGRGD